VTSWTEPSLISSGWYPKGTRTAEQRLRWYATQFPIVENDSTYYAIPTSKQGQLWAERTPEGFTMNVKAFAALTGHYTDPRRLPPDLRDSLPEEVRSKRRVYPKDLGEERIAELGKRLVEAIEPLRAAGRLGVVLFQYPVWFPASPENHTRIKALPLLAPGVRIAIEFRNATWMSDKNRDRTLAFLRDVGLVYTCVDEPQGFISSIPPIAAATADLALVRFHGRSATRWNRQSESARERFRYRYATSGLCEWVPKIQQLADEARAVHVLMNNCYSNYAVTNAREMTALLGAAAATSTAPTSLPSTEGPAPCFGASA
jgi:uncharacterized protein YecE (DUF72 family)